MKKYNSVAYLNEMRETLKELLSLCDLEDEHGRLVIKTRVKDKARELLNKA